MLPRLRASLQARRGKEFFFILDTSLIRRGGAPSGAAGFIESGGMGVSTPIIISEVEKLTVASRTYKNQPLVISGAFPG